MPDWRVCACWCPKCRCSHETPVNLETGPRVVHAKRPAFRIVCIPCSVQFSPPAVKEKYVEAMRALRIVAERKPVFHPPRESTTR